MSRSLLVNRNIRAIAITGLISGVYIGMLNVALQLFPGTLGFGVAALGVLQALGNRFSGVAATFVQPLAGHYSDLHSRRQAILLGSVTTIASMVCFMGAALSRDGYLVLSAFVLYGVSILGSPASQAMVAESVGLDSRQMDVAYSLIFFMGTVPGVVFPYLAGALAETYGYLLIFTVAATLESLDLYLYWRGLAETRHIVTAEPVQGSTFSLREAFTFPKSSWGYFGALAMDAFAFGISSNIIYAMAEDRFHFTASDVGLLVAVWYLAMLASQYPATRILIRLGPKRTLMLSELLGTLLMAGWAISNSLPEFLASSVVFGVSVTTWVPGVSSLLMTHSPPKTRGGVGGKVAAFRGLVAFPAPIVGGFLYQYLGYEAPIAASLVGTVVCVALMFRYLPEHPTASREKAK
ncbi:MAG: MFS transporter [Nitrososphaerota archaeon]|nr:MFS transporter [Nitrososphaerota archaeon]MDG6903249.1 MFS transporter [Nitrososphaerota archaeon]MDG6911727.1 MFS transporter [Nitrososphaerota archaeon]MDG6940629.1 MFS transporter [Nitrososphaerota archaeon]MDG6960939.1 MFS transporter [Nitrososphaerota archaeon]